LFKSGDSGKALFLKGISAWHPDMSWWRMTEAAFTVAVTPLETNV
jgi:hypothetical protein